MDKLPIKKGLRQEDAIQLLTSVNTEQTKETESFRLANKLYDDDKLALISELSEKEIAFLVRLDTIERWCSDYDDTTKKYQSHSRLIDVVRNRFLSYRVSKLRQGRKEVFDAMKSLFMGVTQPISEAAPQQGGFFSRWFKK